MIKHNFDKILKETVLLSKYNNFKGNDRFYPDFMYPDYDENMQSDASCSKNIPEDLLLDKVKFSYDFNLDELVWSYNALSDKFSQELFVKLVAFRILGSAKVKLPLTDYSLFSDYFAIVNTKKNISSMFSDGSYLHELSSLGVDISMFYNPYEIFITFFRKQYEYGTIKAKLGDYVIDGGACVGDTALYFANIVGKSGKVYSFEFIKNNLIRLEENLNLNQALKGTIEIVKHPLWENSDKELFTIEDGPASHCVDVEPQVYNEKVKSISIDDFVLKNKISKIDFIKFDIEGAEPHALLGAKNTIQRFKPNLAICIYHKFRHFFEVPKIIKTILPEYNLYVDHHSIHLGETVLYASVTPAERDDSKSILEKADIVVIDSTLPNGDECGSKNAEILEFSKQLKNFTYYSMSPMLPKETAWLRHGYGMTKREYTNNLRKYLKIYPSMANNIAYLAPDKKYSFNLAFSYFLAETYTLLPIFKKNSIPFAFLLAHGGAFEFDNDSSDAMLRELVDSKLCRMIFVCHHKMRDYLLRKNICSDDLVHYDPLRASQLRPENLRKKKFYKKDKSTFDICFIASKCAEGDVDKGFDIFIETAKRLARAHDDIRFHVVGDFTSTDIDIAEIKDKIIFRSTLSLRFLPSFFADMDINLSFNWPFKIFEDSFENFPVNSMSLYCGVCGFSADPLGLTADYVDGEDIIIIDENIDAILDKVHYYYSDLEELYRISHNGQKKSLRLLDTQKCIANRIEILNKIKEKTE